MGGIRVFAFLFGIGFLALGIMGYIPVYFAEGDLFGYFQVDNVHNIIHIASGILAFLIMLSATLSRLYFQIIGVVYAILAVLGFSLAGDLFITHANMADNVLNLSIAIVTLYLGFLYSSRYI